MTVTNYATADVNVQTRSRDRFFLAMSGLLLLILVVGFSRTLYLRLFFEVPPIPSYLHIHGATVTAWFVWLVVQASLVNVNRIDVHRRNRRSGDPRRADGNAAVCAAPPRDRFAFRAGSLVYHLDCMGQLPHAAGIRSFPGDGAHVAA